MKSTPTSHGHFVFHNFIKEQLVIKPAGPKAAFAAPEPAPDVNYGETTLKNIWLPVAGVLTVSLLPLPVTVATTDQLPEVKLLLDKTR